MKLNEVKTFLSDVPFIDNGGCLVSAYAIILFSLRNGLDVPKLAGLTTANCAFLHMQNSAFLSGLRKTPSVCNHFGYTYNEQHYEDQGGYLDLDFYAYLFVVPSELSEKFYRMTMKASGWNTAFNRKRWIPKIEKTLDIDLSY